MLLIEDVEQLLESAQMASYSSTAFYDIKIGLKRALGLNRIRQSNTDVTI